MDSRRDEGPERSVGPRRAIVLAGRRPGVDALAAGDALKASGVTELVLEKGEQAEVLLFDLA